MMSAWVIVALAAVVIIVGLALYAGKLLAQLKLQTQRQRQAIDKRNARILESIHTIALAVSQDQCNLSEGAIRLTHLLNALQFTQPQDFRSRYPRVHELYEKVKEMPTHEARKEYKRNEIMRFDLQRAGFEHELEDKIKIEVKELARLEVPAY